MTDEANPQPAVAPDAAPEVAPVSDETPPPVVSAAPPEVDKTQKRIDELTWKNAELRRQLEVAAQRPAEAPPPPKPTPVRPTADQFASDAEYQKAQDEYLDAIVDQRIATRLERAEEQRRSETLHKTFVQRQTEFAKANPEYVEKVLSAQTLPISAVGQELIKEMEAGPEVALYLVNHPEEAYDIAQLPERSQARVLGRIEARFDKSAAAKSPPPAPRVSQAPPPAAKIEATDSTVRVAPDNPDSDNLSDAEWRKARDRQEAKRRAARQ